ncbi:chromate efflux transporter [Legionella longbeachae]|uniref:Putative chromate transporter n=1 Tax=Legionella longbeachae serogroup 1 (strain NSW150) TaxID=661367 RepID=D3HJL6_LEGLN|nr:chromate efflux transporter [Legionella longbeachae]VEE03144.1 chromate transporter [Legionella oakridgensis]HBD7398947.1 chromate efflux transporter [Legionella pneumophila]ARB93956.1 chromate transporter [Legionella longbeachae]ARM32906.1 chromate efflux transporter [Legionella longbeachae]EEZ94279.1 chromate transporter [Legionella longbeachae D-4968]
MQELKDNVTTTTIFIIFLKLGCICFGGPVAHIGYFRHEFVNRLKWLSDHAYADLVALCQFLPGPASSQVGIALGLSKGGIRGAIAAWLGFTLPSALLMVSFGLLFIKLGIHDNAPWLHGLKVVAVAVVAQAIWGMSVSLCPDKTRASLAVFACIGSSIIPYAAGQILMIIIGGIFGLLFLHPNQSLPTSELVINISKRTGIFLLISFIILLIFLPILSSYTINYPLQLFDAFYRSGSLVFGGGHVVLPLLQAKVVPNGWVDNSLFLAGYGAAQALPGPLFTFAAFLGAVSTNVPHGWLGALIALVAIFLPSFLLIVGTLPLWENLRQHPSMQRAILGINASVVGLLLTAFYQPVWSSAIFSLYDYLLAITAFLLLQFWRVPAWIVVLFCAIISQV